MPSVTGIIDTVATPPLASLQQVLDVRGPYPPGNYRLDTFDTNGAFLLPAGTYSISGTYGVIAQVAGPIPQFAGLDVGWVDPFGSIFASGETYEPLIAQLNLIHFLPITSAGVITNTLDMHRLQELMLWPALLLSPANLGLYVSPNWSVDLLYLCVL